MLARYAAEFADDSGPLTLDFMSDQPAEAKTCPWYFDAQPFVASIFELLEDYEKGRLGDVRDLPAPWVDYLRVASDARARWRKYWQDETG